MLQDFLPNKSYAIVAGYARDKIVAALGGVVFHDRSIEIFFPKVNPFKEGQKITFHLDNRTGLEEFDIDLRVYRVSVKAIVLKSDATTIFAQPVEYDLKYSNRSVDVFKAENYDFPVDSRPKIALPEANLSKTPTFNDGEKENKLGVLVTHSVDRPHTTVMAFLSSEEDDIYIISHDDSFKSKNIARNGDCVFAIDHRATFNFDRAIDWNYTLIAGDLRKISRTNPLFPFIQSKFVEKNPWEYAFFTDAKVEMYQIKAREIMCPEKLLGSASD